MTDLHPLAGDCRAQDAAASAGSGLEQKLLPLRNGGGNRASRSAALVSRSAKPEGKAP